MPPKVHRIKAMVFLVVMYGCESWTIKKGEHQKIGAFELWCWRKLLSPLDCMEIKPVNSKGNQSWTLMGRTVAEAKAPILWLPDVKSWLIGKDSDTGKIEGKKRRGQQRMRWLDRIIDSVDMNLSKLWKIVEGRKAWHAVVHGISKSQTWFNNWITTIKSKLIAPFQPQWLVPSGQVT